MLLSMLFLVYAGVLVKNEYNYYNFDIDTTQKILYSYENLEQLTMDTKDNTIALAVEGYEGKSTIEDT